MRPLDTMSHFFNRSGYLTFGLLMACLPSCGQRLTNENIDALNAEYSRRESVARQDSTDHGISPKEVESYLGPPTEVVKSEAELVTGRPIVPMVRYIYKQGADTVELHFWDNKLASKARRFGEPEPTPPPHAPHGASN